MNGATIREAVGSNGSYYVVWSADGKVEARGSWEMCDAIVRGIPLFAEVGDLFDPAPVRDTFVNNQPDLR